MEIITTVCAPVMSKPPGTPCLELSFVEGDTWKIVKLDRQDVQTLAEKISRFFELAESELDSTTTNAT